MGAGRGTDGFSDEQSVAGAIFQTSIQLASAFGICLSSLVANEQSKSSGNLYQGLRDAFGMNVAWAWIGEFLSAIGYIPDPTIHSVYREQS
jgi:hypothetical protein